LGQPDKIYFVYTENHFNSKNIQKMPEYLLPFEENTIFLARTRQIQKRPFSLAIGAVIIPGIRNKVWKIKRYPEFSR
jgi:hypothetical protein